MRLFNKFLSIKEDQSDNYKSVYTELLQKYDVKDVDDLNREEKDDFFRELISKIKE